MSLPQNASYMFYNCSSLASLDASGWDTSSVTSMIAMFSGCSSLASLDLSGWDTSSVADMRSMFSGCSSLASLDLSGWDTSSVTDIDWMFSGCSQLASLDLSGLDTSSVAGMGYMFHGCSSLASLDLSGWDTSSVTSMYEMFSGCSSLASLDLSGWDTSSVADMRWMFSGCSSLASLDLSGWDTSSVTSMYEMFSGCSSLASLDLSGWDTSSVTDMSYMFYDCSSLSSLDASGWDTSSVTYMGSMFSGCSALASLDLSGWDTSSVTGMGSMFSGCSSLSEVKVGERFTLGSGLPSEVWVSGRDRTAYTTIPSFVADTYTRAQVADGWKVSGSCVWRVDDEGTLVVRPAGGADAGTLGNWGNSYQGAPWYAQRGEIRAARFEGTVRAPSCYGMFYGCSSLASLDLSGLDTSSVTSMYEMFYGCSKLASLDLSGWDTSSVTDMRYMFRYCSSLASLDLSGLDTSSTTNMYGMFVGCSSLASLDLSGWDTSSVTSMYEMFDGCSKLASLDASGWDTSSVTSMYEMFSGCSSLASLDLSGWDTSSVIDMRYMFRYCSSLASLDLSGWDTSSVTSMYEMFYGCSSLASLDLSGWDTSSVTNMEAMFYGCSSLASLDASGWDTSSVTSMGYMFSGCSALASLDLSGWDTSSVTSMGDMFDGCSSLASLDASGWDTSSVTDISNLFFNSSIKGITVGESFQVDRAFPTGASNWWSMKDERFFSVDEIRSSRVGVADTYLAKKPETITVSVRSTTKTYGSPDPSFEVEVSGGDSANVKYAIAREPGDEVGSYRISITGDRFQNGCYVEYSIGVLTIEPKTVTVHARDASKAYGEDDPQLTADVDGLLGNDQIEYALSRKPGEGVGSYDVVVSGEELQGNYRVSYEPGTFKVAPRDVRVAANDATKAFGDSDPDFTANVTNLLGDDSIEYSLSREQGEDVGTYAITPEGEEVQGNYRVTYESATLSIGAREVTVRVGDATKVYGEQDPSWDISVGGIVDGYPIDYAVSRQEGEGVGEYPIVPSGDAVQGNYTIRYVPGRLTITHRPVTVKPLGATKVFGEEDPDLEAGVEGLVGDDSIDYSLSREPGESVGRYAVTARGNELQGNYRVSYGLGELRIEPRHVTVTAGKVSKVYGEKDPKFTASVEGLLGDDAVAYGLSRGAGENAGTYAITPNGDGLQGNYEVGFVVGSLTIEPRSLADSTIAPIDPQLRTGTAITPKPTVTLGGKTLALGTDYTLSYLNNVNAGTATVKVTGKGNYTGEATATFRIGSKSISSRNVSLLRSVYLKSEMPTEPRVVPRDSLGSFVKGVDYSVSYSYDAASGKGSVVVTGEGDYVGRKEIPFDVVDRIDISDEDLVTVSVDPGAAIYRGEPVTTKASILVGLDAMPVEEGVDYSLKFYRNDRPGQATVAVTGLGDYKGSRVVSFTILDRSKIVLDEENTIVEYEEPLFYVGETPAYLWRTGSTFPRPKVTSVSYYRYDLGMLGFQETLTRGVDYDVQYWRFDDDDVISVARVDLVAISPLSGTLEYWYDGVSVVAMSMLRLDETWLEQPEYLFEDSPVEPKLKKRGDFVEGVDYELLYQRNDRIGTCTVTVIGMGQFMGTDTIEVPIVGEYSGPSLDACTVEVEGGEEFDYTGSPVTPKVKVTDPASGKVLEEGYDYEVAYENNVGVGTATARVLPCAHSWYSYQGHNSVDFEIVRREPFFLDADPTDDKNHGAEVDWMGTSGISTGWEVAGGREFRGMRDVTRCDFAAFLYRLADLSDDGERNDSNALSSSKVTSVLRGVSDCDARTPHAAEVAWLVDSGISKGWPDKGKDTVSFRPMAKVARQDMAAFLYRFADIRDDGTQNGSLRKGPEQISFSDVRHGDESNHASEVEWLASVGVTRGWGPTNGTYQFRGTRTVARQDMAAFMKRLYDYLG